MLHDEQKECKSEERKKLQSILEDHETLSYPYCKEGHKNMNNTMALMQWKASNGVMNKGFEQLWRITNLATQHMKQNQCFSFRVRDPDDTRLLQ